MTDGTTAADRLERLLYILPAASRPDGATLAELAEALGTSDRRILEDVEEVTRRAYYHPGGWPDNVSILVDADRVRVFHARGLERPVRLTATETFCLALGLRGSSAASHLRDAEARAALLDRAEAHLGPPPGPDGVAAGGDPAPEVTSAAHAPDPAGIRETVLCAARDRRPCALVYARPGQDQLSPRVIHPYAVVYGGGEWYVIGHCQVSDDVRVFRMDRIVEASAADGSFDVPDDFDVGPWVDGGVVYRPARETRVRVRYSPRVARWVRERADAGAAAWTEQGDGSVVVDHRVADPHWMVEHALQYGLEAEILEPADVRALVVDLLDRLRG